MGKAVLISIKPEWCKKIITRNKVVEIRKTRPKMEVPFKVYVYECKSTKLHAVYKISDYNFPEPVENPDENVFIKKQFGKGMVIGEFTCDRISSIGLSTFSDFADIELACLSVSQARDYSKGKLPLYAWHIKDFKLYEKPKPLENYFVLGECKEDCNYCSYQGCNITESKWINFCTAPDGYKKLTKPPQSWCYVEERLEGEDE